MLYIPSNEQNKFSVKYFLYAHQSLFYQADR